MKKLFLLVMMMITLSCYSQFSVKMGAGAAYDKKPYVAADIGIGCTFSNIYIGYSQFISIQPTFGGFFQLKSGYNYKVNSDLVIMPFIGYSLYNYNADVKHGYDSYLLKGVELSYNVLQTNNNSLLYLYLNIESPNRYINSAIGLKVVFAKSTRSMCNYP